MMDAPWSSRFPADLFLMGSFYYFGGALDIPLNTRPSLHQYHPTALQFDYSGAFDAGSDTFNYVVTQRPIGTGPGIYFQVFINDSFANFGSWTWELQAPQMAMGAPVYPANGLPWVWVGGAPFANVAFVRPFVRPVTYHEE